MDDAATIEISRSRNSLWMRSPKGVFDEDLKVTRDLFRQLLSQELAKARSLLDEAAWQAGEYEDGARLSDEVHIIDGCVEPLTQPGYDGLTRDLRCTHVPRDLRAAALDPSDQRGRLSRSLAS